MARLSPERLALLRKMLAEQGIEPRSGSAIPRRATSGPARVSFGQRRLWFEEQLEPGTSLYNDSLCVSITGGALDEDLFERSLQEVVARHEVLRTAFVSEGGQPLQLVQEHGRIPLRRFDLRACEPEQREREIERLLLEDVRGTFDLTAPPLVRGTLLRRADDAWEFALTMHHIVSDGVSYSILWRELGHCYAARLAGRQPALEPLPIQYADYAEWERARTSEERVREGVDFWAQALGKSRPEVALPLDFPRASVPRHRGAFHRFRFPEALLASLGEFCRREQLTSNWIFVAGYCALLHGYSGQLDLTIGMPSSTRTERELEDLIGFFVQTLLLRNDLGGDPTFRELVERTRARALDMSRWEDIPFDRIVQAIRPGRGTAVPLIQAWIAPMKDLMPKLELAGMRTSYRIVDPKNARFDLCLILDETSEGIEAYFEYDVDLFRPATVRSMAERYLALLRQVVDHPATRLELLSRTLARTNPLPAATPLDASALARPEGKKPIPKARRRVADG